MPWPVEGGGFPNKEVELTPKILITAYGFSSIVLLRLLGTKELILGFGTRPETLYSSYTTSI